MVMAGKLLVPGRTWEQAYHEWPEPAVHRVDVKTVAYDTFRRVVEALFDLLVTIEVIPSAANSDKIDPATRYFIRTIYVDDASDEWLVLEAAHNAATVEVPLSLVTGIVVL